jgi:Cd2+/Zn2+-exporting ATPase
MPFVVMGTGVALLALGILLKTFLLENPLVLGSFSIEHPIALLVFLIVIIFVGHGVILHGIKALFKGEVRMELLMTIATVGAFLLGDGLEGASLMLLYYLAEYIEDLALDRSKKSLSKLVNLNPEKATLRKGDSEVEVGVEELKLKDIVLVRPGDKIPIDGVIVKGNTSVNQSSITGESLAVDKNEGDEVYASTINEEGYIEVEVTKTSKNTIFSKIVELIKESEEKKAKIDIFIDQFAKYYTPLVVFLAILVVIVPTFFFNGNLLDWVYKALVLLVISCPCALAISTPVSMVSAITAGTKNGIIIKGGEYVEELNRIKAILFDKTGTLTEGKLEITNVVLNTVSDKVPDNVSSIVSEGISKEKLISIACSLEAMSKHPISFAFKNYANSESVKIEDVENFKSIAGKGLMGDINGISYLIGKKELFENLNLGEDSSLLDKDIGKTRVFIGTKTEVFGFISLNDKLRKEAKQTIANLKAKNIETIMLTGDNESTASEVSNKLGLNSFYADLLPEDKLKKVESLTNQYKDVAMVGDGVNDTPSLARANIGIAMGMGGADVAVETADIVLMNDNLSKIDLLIKIAKSTMNVVKQNVVVVIGVKAILVVLGILGWINLLEAIIIGDTGLALLVVANAFRIGR